MAEELLICWATADGAEHEEAWPSLDAFLAWATTEGLHGSYRSYEADEDGDHLLVAKGSF